ncbi:hypothetical protein Pmani_019751 [Petrolisthes manimaculis]|uniref:Uncharacterized protein n=1 Tax=Petrolisthes manimaculis TaxID=1843537 RepID=A0AAE1PIZ3_9EUCA|nr:hypothetical protein Pmani_019751 [Petrolisthes manimaculis]
MVHGTEQHTIRKKKRGRDRVMETVVRKRSTLPYNTSTTTTFLCTSHTPIQTSIIPQTPTPVSPLHLPFHHTCLSTTPASPPHLPLHHTCLSTTPASPPHLPFHHTCLSITPASPPHLLLHHTKEATN